MGTYHIRRRLKAFREKHLFLGDPVAAAVKPGRPFLSVPAGVYHQKIYAVALDGRGYLFEICMGRISPGSAVFIKQYRKIRIRPGHVFTLHGKKPLAHTVHAATAYGNVSFRSYKCFAGGNGL